MPPFKAFEQLLAALALDEPLAYLGHVLGIAHPFQPLSEALRRVNRISWPPSAASAPPGLPRGLPAAFRRPSARNCMFHSFTRSLNMVCASVRFSTTGRAACADRPGAYTCLIHSPTARRNASFPDSDSHSSTEHRTYIPGCGRARAVSALPSNFAHAVTARQYSHRHRAGNTVVPADRARGTPRTAPRALPRPPWRSTVPVRDGARWGAPAAAARRWCAAGPGTAMR